MFEMQNCLTECQKTFSAHPQYITQIRNHFSDPKLFMKDLFRYLKRILFLTTPKMPLKRLLKFLARISTFPATDEKSKNWVDDYSNGLILFTLKYVRSEKRSAKLKSLELISCILNDLPDDFALNESVYTALFDSVYPLLEDPKETVRSLAVVCLARLQEPLDEKDRITGQFLRILTSDPNRKVREACLTHIGLTKHTLPTVLTRTRDSSEIVRKTAYFVLKTKLDIKSLSIFQRNGVLRCGLRDRDSNVRDECSSLLLEHWIPSCEHILNFLGLLDVEENEKDAEIILEHIFTKNPDLDEKSLPPFSADITAEKAILWRVVCAQINKKTPVDWPLLDKVLMETADFVNLLDSAQNDFIFKQLVGICRFLDFKDEANRNQLISKSQSYLQNLNTASEFTSPLCSITRTIFKSEKAHARHLMRIILHLLEELEKCTKNAELKKEKKQEVETMVYTRVLDIIKDMLRFSKLGKNLPDIGFIKEKLILPCVTKDNPFIRAHAIEALALYCYFDVAEARKYIVLLYHVLKNDQEALQLIALKSVIDLLLTHHELATLDCEPLNDEQSSSQEENSHTLVDALASFLGSDDELMMYTAVEGFAKLITLGRVCTVKPLSMCILLLFNPNSSEDEPVQQCLSLFFSSFLFLAGKSVVKNLRLFAKAFLPTLKIILHAPEASPLSRIDTSRFGEWAFSFLPATSEGLPDKLLPSFERNVGDIVEIRRGVLLSLLSELGETDFSEEEDNKEQVTISKMLLKLQSGFKNDEEIVERVKKVMENVEECNECDKFVKIYLRRFLREIKSKSS